ncbi:putative beta-xylosidase [Bacillus sp. TS-2]|nr:putative beta-xylosidase [Bacillus sp. TS-2]
MPLGLIHLSFFDDDGKVYYTGNRQPPEGQKHAKHMEIWLQELDLEEKQLVGPKFSIWDGALQVAHAQESPHLYKKDGYYYLIIAEGGTGHTHAVTIARSQSISGPYEGNKMNPILTHRHLGRNEPIVNVGHADIVQTQNDEWWMVALASRPYGGYYRNLGRESFLVPFIWEDGWPIVNPGVGKIESEMKRPELPEHRYPAQPYCDHFDSETLGLQWNFIRTPREDFYSLQEHKGFLRLSLKKESLTDEDNPSFIGRRQQHFSFLVETALEFTPSNEHETAGLVLRSNEDFHYLIEFSKKEENEVLRLTSQENGEKTILKEVVVPVEKRKYLKIEALEQDLTIRYSSSTSDNWQILLEGVDARLISTDVAGGFTGAYIGMYGSSNGKHSENYADFDYFTYQPLT